MGAEHARRLYEQFLRQPDEIRELYSEVILELLERSRNDYKDTDMTVIREYNSITSVDSYLSSKRSDRVSDKRIRNKARLLVCPKCRETMRLLESKAICTSCNFTTDISARRTISGERDHKLSLDTHLGKLDGRKPMTEKIARMLPYIRLWMIRYGYRPNPISEEVIEKYKLDRETLKERDPLAPSYSILRQIIGRNALELKGEYGLPLKAAVIAEVRNMPDFLPLYQQLNPNIFDYMCNNPHMCIRSYKYEMARAMYKRGEGPKPVWIRRQTPMSAMTFAKVFQEYYRILNNIGPSTTIEGPVRDSEGRTIDCYGNLVNHYGEVVSPEGHLIDKYRRRVNRLGELVDANGNFVDADGNPVESPVYSGYLQSALYYRPIAFVPDRHYRRNKGLYIHSYCDQYAFFPLISNFLFGTPLLQFEVEHKREILDKYNDFMTFFLNQNKEKYKSPILVEVLRIIIQEEPAYKEYRRFFFLFKEHTKDTLKELWTAWETYRSHLQAQDYETQDVAH